MRHAPFGLLALIVALALLGTSTAQEPPGGAEMVAGGGFVVAIAFHEDGTLVWGELEGEIWRLDPDASRPRLVHTVETVQSHEWGLTGIALAPDFAETGAMFVAYVHAPGLADPWADDIRGTMRIVHLVDGKERIVYSYVATRSHNGGRILVHDGSLYVTNGDHKVNEGKNAQDKGAEEGKVLRMTLDGRPATGNPHEEDAAWHPYAYSMGHRNPFGMAWDHARDHLVLNDPGQSSMEEVNIVRKGGNYGHPTCLGPCDPPRDGMTDPIHTYLKTVTPVGLTVVGRDYYHGTFSTSDVHRLREGPDGAWNVTVIYEHKQGLLDVQASPDGAWLYLGSWDGLYRIPLPPAPADPTPPATTAPTPTGTPTPTPTPLPNSTLPPSSTPAPSPDALPTPTEDAPLEARAATPGLGFTGTVGAVLAALVVLARRARRV